MFSHARIVKAIGRGSSQTDAETREKRPLYWLSPNPQTLEPGGGRNVWNSELSSSRSRSGQQTGPWYRTTYIARDYTPSRIHRIAIVVRFELDKRASISVVLDDERATAVLRIALGVTDIKHVVQRDWSLIRRKWLFDLTKYLIHVMKTRSISTTGGIQLLACLDD